MSYNGAGVFQLAAGNPVVTGTVISSTWANNTLSDIANNGLSNCITKDGQQTVTANIPFNSNRLTGVANGVATSDAATVGQIQSGSAVTLTGLSGTGDAIVANSTPAITAYTAGQTFVYIPATTNTISNPTINISTVGAKTITQSNGLGLWAGALAVGTPYVIFYDGTNFRIEAGQLGGFSVTPQGQPFCMRNRFIDGNFDFWDTGTSISLSGGTTQFLATMWKGNPGGGSGAATVTRATITPGADPIALESPVRYALQWAQTTQALTTNPALVQVIEGVASFSGRSATLSCTLATTSGTLNVTTAYFVQAFGTGGSPSSQVQNTVSVNWNITTTPTRFSVRLDVPSISGKTLGTNGDDAISFGIQLPLATTFTIQTYQWQVEDCAPGAPATGLPTPFEFRGYALERRLIDRYFQVFNPGTAIFAAVIVVNSTTGLSLLYVPSMRAAGSVTNLTSGNVVVLPSGSLSGTSPWTMTGTNTIRLVFTLTGATAGQSGTFSVSGGTINLDARL